MKEIIIEAINKFEKIILTILKSDNDDINELKKFCEEIDVSPLKKFYENNSNNNNNNNINDYNKYKSRYKKFFNKRFDMLIYVIDNIKCENNIAIKIIEYLIQQQTYNKLNYAHSKKNPLFQAISHSFFKIADILIRHGADINYCFNTNTQMDAITYLIYHLKVKGIKKRMVDYCIHRGFCTTKIPKKTMKSLISSNNCKIVKTIFDHTDIDKTVILDFLFNYKMGTPLSTKKLNLIIKNRASKIKIGQEMYSSALLSQRYDTLKLLFDYDDTSNENKINIVNNLKIIQKLIKYKNYTNAIENKYHLAERLILLISPRLTTKDYEKYLLDAARNNDNAILKILLFHMKEKKILNPLLFNVNQLDFRSLSFYICGSEKLDCTELLIDNILDLSSLTARNSVIELILMEASFPHIIGSPNIKPIKLAIEAIFKYPESFNQININFERILQLTCKDYSPEMMKLYSETLFTYPDFKTEIINFEKLFNISIENHLCGYDIIHYMVNSLIVQTPPKDFNIETIKFQNILLNSIDHPDHGRKILKVILEALVNHPSFERIHLSLNKILFKTIIKNEFEMTKELFKILLKYPQKLKISKLNMEKILFLYHLDEEDIPTYIDNDDYLDYYIHKNDNLNKTEMNRYERLEYRDYVDESLDEYLEIERNIFNQRLFFLDFGFYGYNIDLLNQNDILGINESESIFSDDSLDNWKSYKELKELEVLERLENSINHNILSHYNIFDDDYYNDYSYYTKDNFYKTDNYYGKNSNDFDDFLNEIGFNDLKGKAESSSKDMNEISQFLKLCQIVDEHTTDKKLETIKNEKNEKKNDNSSGSCSSSNNNNNSNSGNNGDSSSSSSSSNNINNYLKYFHSNNENQNQNQNKNKNKSKKKKQNRNKNQRQNENDINYKENLIRYLNVHENTLPMLRKLFLDLIFFDDDRDYYSSFGINISCIEKFNKEHINLIFCEAIEQGYLKAVKALLENDILQSKIEINKRMNNKDYPIILALQRYINCCYMMIDKERYKNEAFEIFKYLIEKGANYDVKNKKGKTLIQVALNPHTNDILFYLQDVMKL